MKDAVEEERDERTVKGVVWASVILAIGGWLAVGAAFVGQFHQANWSRNPEKWGQFGDYIGGLLNPIVASAALAVLVCGVWLQRKELRATRTELEATREQLSSSVDVAKRANEQAKVSAESTTFFSWLELHHSLVEACQSGNPTSQHWRQGRQVISKAFDYTKQFLNRANLEVLDGDPSTYETSVKDLRACVAHNSTVEGLVGPVFRNLGQLAIFVLDASTTHRAEFAKILAAQLSDHELILLLLFSTRGSESKRAAEYIWASHLQLRIEANDFFSSRLLDEFYRIHELPKGLEELFELAGAN